MRSGFTLIELLVVITIGTMLALGVYVPYQYSLQSARVRLAAETIEQGINEARVSAVSGLLYAGGQKHASIAVTLARGGTGVTLVEFPFDTPIATLAFGGWSTGRELRRLPFEDGVTISKTDSDKDIFILFSPPNGQIQVFERSGASDAVIPSANSTGAITVGYKGVKTGTLSRTITFP